MTDDPEQPRRSRTAGSRRWRLGALALVLAVSGTLTACVGETPERATSSAASPAVEEAPGSSPGTTLTPDPMKLRAQQQRQAARRAARKAARVAARQAAREAAQRALNPLAGRPWGVYKGPGDMAWAPYERATGERKELLAKIALRPKARWFGAWIPNREITASVSKHIAVSQAGDPDALVQMAVFRMVPWEHAACRRLPSRAEAASYRDWIDRFAAGVGRAHTAIILQPDGPFALCAPGGSLEPSQLIGYAARKLAALPNTSVYLDAGAADWPAAGRQGGVEAAVKFLLPAGVEAVRGIALNSTHYSDTNLEVARGAAIVQALEARGIRGKRVVVNTSSSGRPFVFGDYRGRDPDNAGVCRSRTDRSTCVSLGIPPTFAVDDPKWGLSAQTNELARQYVDGYLWFGRPWLHRQNSPFVMDRALDLARSTPYS